jgi:peptidoglycan/LPS O-acetylase OafA/YrhL
MSAGDPLSRHDPATEGLRGLAALMVVYTHTLTPYPHIDPSYAASPFFWKIETSQGAVLLFFVLSGYFIGLTNSAHFERSRVVEYLRRRALRLMPLYLLAVVLGAVALPTDSWATIGGNLLFLQNALPYGFLNIPTLAGNTNLWSLNYEVLYYLLFPLVWWKADQWPAWLTFSAILGIVGWWSPAGGILIASYAAGWAFWLVGFGLARSTSTASETETPLPWPSLLLLWASTWLMKPTWHLAHRFALLPDGQSTWMNWSFYDFIPACVCLLMVTTGRRPRWHRALTGTTLAIPLVYVSWCALREGVNGSRLDYGAGFCLLGLVLWKWRPSSRAFVKLAPVGAISYGIYIFHSPILWLLKNVALPEGSVASFILRSTLILMLTVLIAWWTEKRLQPWIKKQLSPVFPARPPANQASDSTRA